MYGRQFLSVALACSSYHLIIVTSYTEEGGASVTCTPENPQLVQIRGASLLQSRQKRSWLSSKLQIPLPPPEEIVDPILYLDTVRDALTGVILKTPSVEGGILDLGEADASALRRTDMDEGRRYAGEDWCDFCYTLGGTARVDNVRELVEKTIKEGIPGDFLEAGTWRGGSAIMARAVQKVMGEGAKRHTYLCDSFAGLPLSSTNRDDDIWSHGRAFEVSQSEVEDNVKRFHVLDSNVHFKKGYFFDTLPKLRQEFKETGVQLAVLRGDGDMYESWMDMLYNLYEFVPVGGYVICDDCPSLVPSQEAVLDFCEHHKISTPIQAVKGSGSGTFWRKESLTVVNYSHYLEWNATRIFRNKSNIIESDKA